MFRFTIRDLLWLTLVVAFGTGFIIERREARSQERRVRIEQAEKQAMQAEVAEARRARQNLERWTMEVNRQIEVLRVLHEHRHELRLYLP